MESWAIPSRRVPVGQGIANTRTAGSAAAGRRRSSALSWSIHVPRQKLCLSAALPPAQSVSSAAFLSRCNNGATTGDRRSSAPWPYESTQGDSRARSTVTSRRTRAVTMRQPGSSHLGASALRRSRATSGPVQPVTSSPLLRRSSSGVSSECSVSRTSLSIPRFHGHLH